MAGWSDERLADERDQMRDRIAELKAERDALTAQLQAAEAQRDKLLDVIAAAIDQLNFDLPGDAWATLSTVDRHHGMGATP